MAQNVVGELPIKNGTCCKLVVLSVSPVKDEMKEIEALMAEDLTADPIKLAPWQGGLTLRVAILSAMNYTAGGEQAPVVSNVIVVKEDGSIELPYGHHGVTGYDSVQLKNVASGKFKVKDPKTFRTNKLFLPKDFETWSARDRFQFWRAAMGGKYGIPNLKVGTVFYAFMSIKPKNPEKPGLGSWFDFWPDAYLGPNEKAEAPRRFSEIPLDITQKINASISDRWDAEKRVTTATGTTPGASTGAARPPGVDEGGFDWNVGF